MAYKEIAKQRRNVEETAFTVTREVIVHIMYFVSGLLVSRGAVMGELSPFGASFASAVPFSYMPSGLMGAIVGFLIKNPVDSFRYIAIVISIGALRWVLNEFKKVSQSRFFPCVVAFIPVFITGVALTFSSSSELSQITLCLMEAILSSAGAYFMSRTVTLFGCSRSLSALNNQEIACIAMSGCILLLAFSSLTVGDISIGRIMALLIILISAQYCSISGGTIAGVATGIVFSLSSNDLMFLSAGYAFSGLMGGLFSPAGKLAVALSVIICNLTMAFSSSDDELIFAVFIESIVASFVFMLLPKSLGNYVSTVFSKSERNPDSEAVTRAVTTRLSFASKALENVSSCVNNVSQKLSRLYTPNASWIYENACEHTCSRCGMRYYCFEKQKEAKEKDFHSLTNTLKKNGFVKENDIEENFSIKCCRVAELVDSINQSYKEYLSCEAARRRITQVRSVVASQFAGLSDILQDMSEEFKSCERFDTECSVRVEEALLSLGLSVIDCSCRLSKGRGMVVEITIILNNKVDISKSVLTKEVSISCGRAFESPMISYEGDRAKITLCERPNFDVEIGSAQHIYGNGELCGDCLNYFNNGMGSTVLILSDGMGTGGRAAVDSNMAVSIMSKLLKAGLSYDCSLQVVNSSLMIKSEEESLSTLDIVDFNLFTGKTEFLKAGACVTYIKKNSRLYKKDMSSLPIGILNEVKFSKESMNLSQGDIVVMVSDGVITGDERWLEKEISSWSDKSMEELAFSIVEEAKKRRNDGHDDDITALCVRVLS
ncbi:MAG: SpoIIE family protein phosphatase [Ruminococcus sp.]|nr:SpoIIE family protein phosphatase [Ruminococcus sp.]